MDTLSSLPRHAVIQFYRGGRPAFQATTRELMLEARFPSEMALAKVVRLLGCHSATLSEDVEEYNFRPHRL